MFVCAKCNGSLFMKPSSLVEDVTYVPPEDLTPYCLINTRNHYTVKMVFSCPRCRVDYVIKAASKFVEYPS